MLANPVTITTLWTENTWNWDGRGKKLFPQVFIISYKLVSLKTKKKPLPYPLAPHVMLTSQCLSYQKAHKKQICQMTGLKPRSHDMYTSQMHHVNNSHTVSKAGLLGKRARVSLQNVCLLTVIAFPRLVYLATGSYRMIRLSTHVTSLLVK